MNGLNGHCGFGGGGGGGGGGGMAVEAFEETDSVSVSFLAFF
jgi:hypothetical protein